MGVAAEAVSLGRHAQNQKNLSVAREHYSAAARAYRDENDVLAYAHTIRHIADTYLGEANLDEAKPLYEEALEIYRSNLNTKLLDLANTVRPYALLNERAGEFDRARQFWREAGNLYGSLRIEAGVEECESRLVKLR
jgi:tetratricopeptide (TPR) repeat protein